MTEIFHVHGYKLDWAILSRAWLAQSAEIRFWFPRFVSLDDHVFSLPTITTRIVYKKGFLRRDFEEICQTKVWTPECQTKV